MRISLFIVINTKLKTRYPCMYRFQINLFMVIRSHYTFKCMRCGKKITLEGLRKLKKYAFWGTLANSKFF